MSEKYERAALQDPQELLEFIAFAKREKVRSYLEIGSKHGGSLWRVATALPRGARIVAVDLPHGDASFKESEPHLKACVHRLRVLGYDAHLFIGDSTDPGIIQKVATFKPFDLVFIDANHTRKYVTADFQNYGSMGRLVAFHDVGFVKRDLGAGKMPIDVPEVWQEIKQGRKFSEIRRCPRDNGIGILWNA